MEPILPVYTDLTITAKEKISLARYFKSIQRNIPEGWSLSKKKVLADYDTFKMLNDVICFCHSSFKDKERNQIISPVIHLGLTDDAILILKIDLGKNIPKDESIEIIGFVIHLLHSGIFKKNKHYQSFEHKFELGGLYDENWYKTDIREERTIKLQSEKDGSTFFLAKSEKVIIENKTLSYSPPNNISLSLSLMKKSLRRAKLLYKKLFNQSEKK